MTEEPELVTGRDVVQVFVSDPFWKLVYPKFYEECVKTLWGNEDLKLLQAAMGIMTIYNELWVVRDAKYNWTRTMIGAVSGGTDDA